MIAPTQLPVGSKLVSINEQLSVMPPLSGPNKSGGTPADPLAVPPEKHVEVAHYTQVKRIL